MSSFYYCKDCKKAVDLMVNVLRPWWDPIYKDGEAFCKECDGTNWEVRND